MKSSCHRKKERKCPNDEIFPDIRRKKGKETNYIVLEDMCQAG
jgi:hypothetical protein